MNLVFSCFYVKEKPQEAAPFDLFFFKTFLSLIWRCCCCCEIVIMKAKPSADALSTTGPDWAKLPTFVQPHQTQPSHHSFKKTRLTGEDIPPRDGDSEELLNESEISDGMLDALVRTRTRQQQQQQQAEGAAAGEETLLEVEEETWIPRPVKSRRIEAEFAKQERQIRDPKDYAPDQCFGCETLDGEGKQQAAIPTDDIEHMRTMVRKCYGRMKTFFLAKGLVKFYETHVRPKVNDNLLPGYDPLPAWPVEDCLHHLRFHHQDPQAKIVMLLEEVEELREEIYGTCLEESSRTGKVRSNSRAVNDFDKLTKLQLSIHSKDPTKMAFYDPGGRINPDATTQGVLSVRTKTLHDYMKS